MTTSTKAPKVTFTYQPSPREPQHIVEMNTVFVEAYNARKPAYRIINLDTGEVNYSVKRPAQKPRVEIEVLRLPYLYAELTDSNPNPD